MPSGPSASSSAAPSPRTTRSSSPSPRPTTSSASFSKSPAADPVHGPVRQRHDVHGPVRPRLNVRPDAEVAPEHQTLALGDVELRRIVGDPVLQSMIVHPDLLP